ncbi:hypothetical protein DSM104443_00398 [Usitatibacter rugosus]|uniref:Uncharacterized protein n=1 Tax=Usitatibacter rugosus TaxID=2732067 RepID=A0A6M4GRF4_9PROT|nr:hypothetical protein [Usitatibacter rugosus]QJR09358.1 hypothetical protein DSM104443_00398 [Usitatibacter rugosus]
MSYDVTLFVPSGDAPLEEQVDEEPSGEPTDEDRARLAALRASLLTYDPAVKFDEGAQDALVVIDGEKIPDLAIGPRRATVGMSMASDPRALYGMLHEIVGLFAKHGFVAYDYQLGAVVKPDVTFRAFMQQFRSQWDTPASFEAWLEGDAGGAQSPSKAPQTPAKKGVSALGVVFGVLILLWALYKLHKAGYF